METRYHGVNPRIHQIVNNAAVCALGSKTSAATTAEVTAPLRLGRATITVTTETETLNQNSTTTSRAGTGKYL